MCLDSAGKQLGRIAIGGGPAYQVDTPEEMLHSHLVWPLPETGMGFQYFITAIDDYCFYAMVGLLRNKNDAVGHPSQGG